MKVLIILCTLISACLSRSVLQTDVLLEGPACPIDDPLLFDGQTAVNITRLPIFKVNLGSTARNVVIDGLSTLSYTLAVNALTLTGTFDVSIGQVSGRAIYHASGLLDASPFSDDLIPSGDFRGNGVATFSLEGFRAKGNVSVDINIVGNRISFPALELEIWKFDSLSVDLGNAFRIGGKRVNWSEFNDNIKDGIDREFSEKKTDVVEKIRETVNNEIAKYTLYDFVCVGPLPCDNC